MTYADAPDTSTWPVVELVCGHSKTMHPADARTAQANPAFRVWCSACALNVIAKGAGA